MTLAPSYDHGNSLGFNLEDARRVRQLDRDPHLTEWANKGFADRFEGGRSVTLVDFARHALNTASPGTADYWLGRLQTVPTGTWETVTSGTPEMSEACLTFCVQLLKTNQGRLLDEYRSSTP